MPCRHHLQLQVKLTVTVGNLVFSLKLIPPTFTLPSEWIKCHSWPFDRLCLLVWWDPRGERLIGHVYKGLGRGDGQLHPHTNGASVPHQRHGAQRQHPGLRQRRLHSQDLGHQDGPVPANAARWVYVVQDLLWKIIPEGKFVLGSVMLHTLQTINSLQSTNIWKTCCTWLHIAHVTGLLKPSIVLLTVLHWKVAVYCTYVYARGCRTTQMHTKL